MKTGSTFHELSRDLTVRDRNELLNKINQSLSIADDNESGVVKQEMDREEKSALLEADLKKISVFVRFILWLRSKISGKNEKELFLAGRINKLKRKIKRQHANLTGFETRNLTPHFADLVFKLYSAAMPLREIFKKLWIENTVFQVFFLNLIEERLKKVISQPEDITDIDLLVEAYGVDGKKDDLNRHLLAKLDEYIAGIDKKVFTELEMELKPFYYLKDLVLFQYVQFFQQFGYTVLDTAIGEPPRFKNASAILCIGDLEKLYGALYSASRIEKRINFSKSLESQIEIIQSVSGSDMESRDLNIAEAVSDFVETAQDFFEKVPLADLIRYFKRTLIIKLFSILRKLIYWNSTEIYLK